LTPFEVPGEHELDFLGRGVLVAGEVEEEVVCLLPEMSFSRRPPSAMTTTEKRTSCMSSAESCSLPARLRRR